MKCTWSHAAWLGRLARVLRKGPLIVYYHTLSAQPLPHISPIYRPKTPQQFEADLEYLTNLLPPLVMPEIVAASRGKPVRPGFLITFDDGLRGVFDFAAALLARRGLSAALFVNPPCLDNQAMSYRSKAALLVSHLQSAPPETKEIARCILAKTYPGCSTENLEIHIKLIAYGQRHLMEELSDAVGLDIQGYLRRERPYLTRAEVSALQRNGWTIGAHSMDHPYYAKIPLAEQLRQTRDSVHMVANMFGQKCRIFAFPFNANGVSDAFYRAAQSESLVDTFLGTAGWRQDYARRLLHRVSLDRAETHIGRTLSLALASSILQRSPKI